MLAGEAGGAQHRAGALHVRLDPGDLRVPVAQPLQRRRQRAVHDRERAPADERLGFAQRQVWLDPGGVTIHHETYGAGRRENGRLGVAHAGDRRLLAGLVPDLGRGRSQLVGHMTALDARDGTAVHVQDSQHIGAVGGVRLERSHARRDVCRGAVGLAAHERRHRRRRRPAGFGVVRQAHGHQQGAEVGVAQAELAEGDGVAADRWRGVVRAAHEDLLRAEHHAHRGPEAGHVESPVGPEEGQQVKAGQIAGRVV